MKRKDLVGVILIAGLSGIISLIISSKLINPATKRQEQVEVVQPIVSTFTQPSDKFFNDKSINPTQIIKIGDNNNQKPLQSGN